jgi:hypothetical protein
MVPALPTATNCVPDQVMPFRSFVVPDVRVVHDVPVILVEVSVDDADLQPAKTSAASRSAGNNPIFLLMSSPPLSLTDFGLRSSVQDTISATLIQGLLSA